MSTLPYHKRYHSDALNGFMPLTLEERGAYQTLLDMMYDRGGPLIDNERLLAGYMNCSVRKWRQVRERLIEKGKIQIDRDGNIANRRARKELENQSKTQRKLIEAGAKGGRTRVENEKNGSEINETGQASLDEGLSEAQAIRASLPEARSKSSVDKSTGGEAADPVDNFDPIKALFDDGIRVLGAAGTPERSARSLIGRWRKQHGDERVALAIAAAESQDSLSQPLEWITKWLSSRANSDERREAGAKPFDLVEAINANPEKWRGSG